MTWRDAIAKTLADILSERKLDVTKISKAAGYPANYLTKLKSGDKRRIDLDELEPILKVLGIDLLEFLRAAQQRKESLHGELTVEDARHIREMLRAENNSGIKYEKLKEKLLEIFPELQED